MSNKPYVVTNDLEIVFSDLKACSITPPDTAVLAQASEKIRASLQDVFTTVEIISAEKILGYLNKKAASSPLPVVSLTGLLDERMTTAAINLSRSVRRVSEKTGLPGYQSLGMTSRSQTDLSSDAQFNKAAAFIRQTSNEAVLIDDVVFSGGTIAYVASELSGRGIRIKEVIASVAIGTAIPKLKYAGLDISADTIYPDVQDEVCMRDFIVGAPQGGRNVISANGLYQAAPYISPYGDVESWASIPGRACEEFSRAVMAASLEIWENIEQLNNRPILVGELSKPVVTMCPQTSIVTQLKRALV